MNERRLKRKNKEIIFKWNRKTDREFVGNCI